MKNELSRLSDQDLVASAKKAVLEESNATLVVIEHLREINRRRLPSSFKCESLLVYCVEHLGYSESKARRRIATLNLVEELPEILSQVQNGNFSIETLSRAQSFFNKEKSLGHEFKREEKLEVLTRIESVPKRECNFVLKNEYSCQMGFTSETERKQTLNVTISQETKEKLNKLRGLLAHAKGYLNDEKLVEELIDIAVQKLDPTTEPKRKAPPAVEPKSVSASTRREVWRRDESKCTDCKSDYALEIDHKIPRSLGGTNEILNLRLLCRKCNQRAAIEKLGQKTMDPFLNQKKGAGPEAAATEGQRAEGAK